MLFKELSAQEYDMFAKAHPCRHFLNSKNAFMVKKEAGYSCFFVGVEENGKIIAACGIVLLPVFRIFYCAYAQRGFLIDYENQEVLTFFVQSLKQYLKNKNVIYLKIDPYVEYQNLNKDGSVIENTKNDRLINDLKRLGFKHNGFTFGFYENKQCRFMCILDLEGKDEKQLLQAMKPQCRYSIQKVERLGIKVRALKEAEYPLFKEIMDATAMRKHFVDMCLERYISQIHIYGKEHAKIMMAYIDVEDFKKRIAIMKANEEENLKAVQDVLKNNPYRKKLLKKEKVILESLYALYSMEEEVKATNKKEIPLSVAYFIFYEDEVIYVSSGSIPSLKKYLGPYAIQWHMIKEALARKVRCYNFYGTSGIFDQSAHDYGVFTFKRGFGAKPIELVGEFVLPIHRCLYKVYACIKKDT